MADTQEPQLPVAPEAPMSGPEQVIAALKAELEPLMKAAAATGKEEEIDQIIDRWEKTLREEDDYLRKETEDTFEYLEAAKKEYAADSPEVREAEEKFDRSMNERKQLREFWQGLPAYYDGALAAAKKNKPRAAVESAVQTPEMKIKALGVQFESEFGAATDDDAKRAICDKYEALVNAITV